MKTFEDPAVSPQCGPNSFEHLADGCHGSAKSPPSQLCRYPVDLVPSSHQAAKPTLIAAAKTATRRASR